MKNRHAVSQFSRCVFEIEEDSQSFFVTAIYNGRRQRYDGREYSAKFRIKFHSYKSGYSSGVKPQVTLEMMLLPYPGTWNEIHSVEHKLKADLTQLRDLAEVTLMPVAMKWALDNMSRETRSRINEEFERIDKRTPTDDDLLKIMDREINERIFPKMRQEKFEWLLQDDFDEILIIAYDMFYS
jgi:hypothetical protein